MVVTFEARVMEAVVEDMGGRPCEALSPLLVVNLDVKDSHEEAAAAAPAALKLCSMVGLCVELRGL